MKKTKQYLSFITAICILISLLSVNSYAEKLSVFTDVPSGSWYSDAVSYVYEHELMKGVSNNQFSPETSTSRGMIVTLLHRLEGTPNASDASFTDVAADSYYAEAVSWANAEKIVEGYGNREFGPNDPITREQMATIFYRYVQYKDYDDKISGNISLFVDSEQVSSYAIEALNWAVGTGLISGIGNNTIAPQGTASRAQVATILMRFCENVISQKTDEQETKMCLITFENNYKNAGTYSTVKVEEGKTIKEPNAPSRSGYTFIGWYTDKNAGSKFDFTTAIKEDLILYAHWMSKSLSSGGSSGGGSSGGSGSSQQVPDYGNDDPDTQVTENDEFILSANEEKVLTEADTEVFFYVNSTLTVPNFELYMNGESIDINLYDNGVESDDIPNDGCYTGVYTIDMDVETNLVFTAKTTVENQSITTNEVGIYVYNEITDEQIAFMDQVENDIAAKITAAKKSLEETASVEEIVAAVRKLTDPYYGQLEQSGKIKNLEYSDESYMYTWDYAETGIGAGYIIYEEDTDPTIKGTTNSEPLNLENVTYAVETSSQENSKLQINTTYSKGSVIILNSFPKNHSWNDAYDDFGDTLEEAGFEVNRVYSFKVEDFEQLESYDSLILINSHGNTYNMKKTGKPMICTEEEVTKANQKKYSSELKRKLIYKITTDDDEDYYWIAPKFFEETYSKNKLPSPIVHLGFCRGYANDELVKAIKDAGACAVSGYSASVYTSYDEPMVRDYISRLLLGDSASEAWNYAKNSNGQQDPSSDTKWKEHAVLHLTGDGSLYHKLNNGNFDSPFDILFGDLTSWRKYGDARSVFRLAGLYPQSLPKMAIISSGFGSLNDETTSSIYQTFLVPEDINTIKFSYDVVSEEPMEFVGTDYNDFFQVDILDTKGNLLDTIAYESVNTSNWYAISGIDFPNGDETTYHTRWKTISSNAIAKYKGQLIVLRFVVQDSGDEIYDTAALVDSISVS